MTECELYINGVQLAVDDLKIKVNNPDSSRTDTLTVYANDAVVQTEDVGDLIQSLVDGGST